jgi:hypothetical protein
MSGDRRHDAIASIFVGEMSAGQAGLQRRQPKLDGLKQAAVTDVDGMRDPQQMVDQIFSYAGLGYRRSKRQRPSRGFWRRTASESSATSPACRPDGRPRGDPASR